MDQSSYAGLRQELRQHIDSLLTALSELVHRTESLSPSVHTSLQSGVAELQAQLQAFDELIESCLTGAGVDAEAQEALVRLIKQVHARQQYVQG